jgi:uncharacterized membrane protein
LAHSARGELTHFQENHLSDDFHQWAYVISVRIDFGDYLISGGLLTLVEQGSTQVTAVNQLGQNYIANVNAGDLWYFPPGKHTT